MLVKIHRAPNDRTIVAVCDKELFGQKFEEGNKQLDLSSDFYNGEERDRTEAGDLVRNADCVNLAGPKAVQLGIEEGVIDEEHVLHVQGIPHAQSVHVHD